MKQGDYARASAAASQRCRQGHSSCFAIWVVAESARVRKNEGELSGLVSALQGADDSSPFARYATYRLASLQLAGTSSGTLKDKHFIPNPDYAPLLAKVHEAWKACRSAGEASIPIAAALATGREAPSELRAVVLKALGTAKDPNSLLLWKARAQMLGVWSITFDTQSGKVDHDQKGHVAYVFREGNEPDMDGAKESLAQFRAKYPSDPRYLYYHARWLCWDGFFFTDKEIDRRNKLAQAVAEMQKFLAANDQPPPLVESGKKFVKKPDPGAFNTPPLE